MFGVAVIALVVTFGGLLAVGLGLLIRNTPGTLTAIFLLMFVLVVTLGNSGVPRLVTISDYLPGRAVVSMLVVDEEGLSGKGRGSSWSDGLRLPSLPAAGRFCVEMLHDPPLRPRDQPPSRPSPHVSPRQQRKSNDNMTDSTIYRIALGIAVGATLFLILGIGALGVIGAEGDRADMMFLGVLAIGLGGAIVTRLRPEGMVWTMGAMAAATMIIGVIAIVLGKHQADESSVAEILGLTGMFAFLFAAAAWSFRAAAKQQRHRRATLS